MHTFVKPTLLFERYYSNKALQSYDWCIAIENSPPPDWILCAKLLTEGCESGNHLDIHTAQVLTSILPMFINCPPDNTIEDSYVYHYLLPLLSSVFSSGPFTFTFNTSKECFSGGLLSRLKQPLCQVTQH